MGQARRFVFTAMNLPLGGGVSRSETEGGAQTKPRQRLRAAARSFAVPPSVSDSRCHLPRGGDSQALLFATVGLPEKLTSFENTQDSTSAIPTASAATCPLLLPASSLVQTSTVRCTQ